MDKNLKIALGALVAACEHNKETGLIDRELLIEARERISDTLYNDPAVHNLFTKE